MFSNYFLHQFCFTTAFCHCHPRKAGLRSGVHNTITKAFYMFIILHEHLTIIKQYIQVLTQLAWYAQTSSPWIYHCIYSIALIRKYTPYWGTKRYCLYWLIYYYFHLQMREIRQRKPACLKRNTQCQSQEKLQ